MKIVQRDEKLAEQERKAKVKQIQEEVKRAEYFEGVKNNKYFQKFVIEEIIDFEIQEAEKSTFKNMATLVSASPEEVKNIMITKSANVILLNKIKARLRGE